MNIECLDTYSRKCLDSFTRDAIQLGLKRIGKQLEEACESGTIKKILEEARCLDIKHHHSKNKQEEEEKNSLNDCHNRLVYSIKRLNGTISSGTSLERMQVGGLCCAMDFFNECVYTQMAKECAYAQHANSKQFIKEILASQLGTFVELDCSRYDSKAKCSKNILKRAFNSINNSFSQRAIPKQSDSALLLILELIGGFQID